MFLKKINNSEFVIFFAAVFFVLLAVKESKIPFSIISLNSEFITNWFTPLDDSGLLFNVSCGAVATFIFWFIDIFVPRHQDIRRLRKYLPMWRGYLKQHNDNLSMILGRLGEGKSGAPNRIVVGDVSTSSIHNSLDFGIGFNYVSKADVFYSINAINTIICNIRQYEHALDKSELLIVYELQIELLMYECFIGDKQELGSNKDFKNIKLIREKVSKLLKTGLFNHSCIST